MKLPADIAATTGALRTAFDRAFAEAPRDARLEDDVLLLVLGGSTYVLKLSQVAGLYGAPRVVRVPTSAPDLLGVCSVRGVLFPVYDLARILGHAASTEGAHESRGGRWIVVTRTQPSVALAFDRLDGHLRVPSEWFHQQSSGDAARHVTGTVEVAGRPQPVLDLGAVVGTIEARNRMLSGTATKER